jgi:hypothetical protein
MGLKDDGMYFLHAFGGGFGENDVANGVYAAGYFVLFGPVDKEFAHFFLMFRRTGLTGEGIEILPQLFGFKVFDTFNCHSCCILRLILFLSNGKCKGT